MVDPLGASGFPGRRRHLDGPQASDAEVHDQAGLGGRKGAGAEWGIVVVDEEEDQGCVNR